MAMLRRVHARKTPISDAALAAFQAAGPASARVALIWWRDWKRPPGAITFSWAAVAPLPPNPAVTCHHPGQYAQMKAIPL